MSSTRFRSLKEEVGERSLIKGSEAGDLSRKLQQRQRSSSRCMRVRKAATLGACVVHVRGAAGCAGSENLEVPSIEPHLFVFNSNKQYI